MSSRFKIGLGLAIFFGLFCTANASAIDYNRTFSGASWYYYTIDKEQESEMLYVPFGETNTEKVAIPAKTCQSYGGFWALLKNGYKEGSNGETVLSGKPVSATVLSDVYYNYKGATWPVTGYTAFKGPSDHQTGPSDNNGNGVSATAFGEMETVLAAYRTLIDTSAVPQTAKDNPGDLSYFCAGSDPSSIPNVTADFVSFSTVSLAENYTSAPVVNGQGYVSEPIVVDATKQETVSVTFRHYFAKSLEHAVEGVAVPYSLSDGDSGSVQTGSMTERFDIGGVNYYAVGVEKTVSLEVSSGEDITYCQAVDFNNGNPSSYNLADYKVLMSSGNSQASSSVCVSIQVITTSPETVSSCDQGGGGEMFEDKNGNKVAGNSVMGSTITTVGISKNGDELFTTTAASRDDAITIYTKPGDTVQFSYALCFGAHNVAGASTGSSDGANNNASVFEVHTSPDGSTDIKDEQYLFGRADDLLGQSIYVAPEDIRGSKISIGSLYYYGSASIKVPKQNEDYITIDNTKKQISFASPDDKLGSEYYAPVIIGGTLSQTLVYEDLAVWPEYLSKSSDRRGPYEKDKKEGGASEWLWGNIRRKDELKWYLEAYKDYQDGYNKSSGYYIFTTDRITKTAGAATPYNFETEVHSEITNHPSSTVQPGDKIEVGGYIDILPRINPLTSDKDKDGQLVPYATTTPIDTRVEVIEFIVRDTVDIDKEYSYEDKYGTHKATLKQILNSETKDTFTNNMICNMYRYYLGDDLGECSSTIVKGNHKSVKDEKLKVVGNPDSNPEGEMGYFNTNNPEESIERIIPDVEAGYKYCVAIGINHGDSHNLPGQILTEENAANEYSVSQETSRSVRTTWKTSKFSCRTVTKEPNFQIWNGGTYADGGISAVISDKTVNTKVSSNLLQNAADEKHRATNPSAFGSWAEYFIVSKSSVTGMASASALGYRTPFEWQSTSKNGPITNHTEYFAANGFGTPTDDYCTLSRLTIANAKCKGGSTGEYASGDTDNETLESTKERILNYYTDDRSGTFKTEYSSIVNSDYGEKINGADFLKVNGPFVIDAQIARPYDSGTLVIKVDGRLTINQNICLGDGICQYNSSDWLDRYTKDVNNLSLNNRNSDLFSEGSLASIPQVILIAENIDIGAEVSQIDAWLITDSDDENYDGGTINTCLDFKPRESGANTCWKTLKINGPVFTANLMLNRTGGAWPGFAGDVGNHAYDILYDYMQKSIADTVTKATSNPNDPISIEAASYCSASLIPEACKKTRIKVIAEREFLEGKSEEEIKAYKNAGNFSAEKSTVSANSAASRDLTCDGSITPAEIFDLHPIVYYWALAESQKTHQAVVTYAQEFAPRY